MAITSFRFPAAAAQCSQIVRHNFCLSKDYFLCKTGMYRGMPRDTIDTAKDDWWYQTERSLVCSLVRYRRLSAGYSAVS
jgi:hypothetical protein